MPLASASDRPDDGNGVGIPELDIYTGCEEVRVASSAG
jgi:hypothetical protein